MASNYKHPGDVLDLTAPAGGVESGMGYVIGDVFVVATADADAAAEFQGQVTGVWELPKTSAQAWTEGQPIAWDAANDRADSNLTLGPVIGVATAAADNPSSVGWVRLHAAGGASARGGGGGSGVVTEGSPTPTSILADGTEVLTAAQFLSGIIVIDPGGASRQVDLPAAAALVAAIPGAEVGDLVRCFVVNGANGAETLTIVAGAGGALDANQVEAIIPRNSRSLIHVRLTNVTAASEAYVAYV
jgi:predicted RecA/RadA family phage recombinase